MTTHWGVCIGVVLAQAPGDAGLVEALEEERHVAVFLEAESIP